MHLEFERVKNAVSYYFFPGNVLVSCDGRIISNYNMYVDFGLIKYQCSCSFTHAFDVQILFFLSSNPGFDGCGTAIQITELNGNKSKISCSKSVTQTIYIKEPTSVKLVKLVNDVPMFANQTKYCLNVFSNSMYSSV